MLNKHQFVDLRSVLTKYFYHWPLFVLVFLLSMAVALTYLHNASPVYEVSATILVKDDKKAPDDKAAIPELEQSGSPKNAEAEIEILKSKKMINKVIDTLQLWANYSTSGGFKIQDLYLTSPFKFVLVEKGGSLRNQQIDVKIKDKNSFEIKNMNGQLQTVQFNSPVSDTRGTWLLKSTQFLDQYIGEKIHLKLSDPQDISNDYVKALDAHLLDKLAPTIGLFITDKVPERGQDFLNHLIAAYNQAGADEQQRVTQKTIDIIDNRIASLKGELNTSGSRIAGYRSSQGITDVGNQVKSYLETMQANNQKLNDVNMQLSAIGQIDQYINSPAADGVVAPSTSGINDPALTSLIEKLSKLQLRKDELKATTPETNTGIFEPINRQITSTKEAIKTTVRGIKANLAGSRQQLISSNSQFQSTMRQLPGQDRHVEDMERQQGSKESLFTYLLQKREELLLALTSTFTDARIVDQANVGDIKWPKTSVIIALALLISLGLPFLIIYLRDTVTHKIVSKREIEEELTVPILAEVAYQDAEDDGVVATDKHTLVSEQFRSLRTNLAHFYKQRTAEPAGMQLDAKGVLVSEGSNEGHMGLEGEGRVTLLTSSISREGKSFVSANLAASLAASGRKTVLLEMDLRKPKISKTFGLPTNHLGISDYLTNPMPLRKIVQPLDGYDNFDIVGFGHIPADATELLERDSLVELVSALRDHYDDVIIDTPPLHLVTDAMIIARTADVSLYLIRQGYTSKDELTFIKEFTKAKKLPNVSIIFNGIRNSKYGYGYKYENSYYNTSPVNVTPKLLWKQFLSRL